MELSPDVTASAFDVDEKEDTELEALINSKSFVKELVSAIDQVSEITKPDRAQTTSSMETVLTGASITECHDGRDRETEQHQQTLCAMHCARGHCHLLTENKEAISALRSMIDAQNHEIEALRNQIEDGSYCPDSDAFDYGLDAVDDVIGDDESDSDYLAEEEAAESLYAQDAADDLAASSEDEESEDEDEQKAAELASDSEYSPDQSAFDYFSDYEADHVYSTSDSAKDSGSTSASSQSEDIDYNPSYDLNDYSLDFEPFQNSDDQDDEDYSIEKDEFDYTQDQEDEFSDSAQSEASSRGSGSEQDGGSQKGSGSEQAADSELAA